MALRISCGALPLQLMRCASPRRLSALYRRPPASARLQLKAAASSYQEAAEKNENDDGFLIAAAAAATSCVPVEVDAAAVEQLGKARRDALTGEGRPNQTNEGSRREILRAMSSPPPPGPPAQGPGGYGGDHH